MHSTFLQRWQSLIGAIIGASAPFLLWWFTKIYENRKNQKERIYFFERLLVDRINNLHESKKTITIFLETTLPTVIAHIKAYDDKTYGIDWAFLPLLAIDPIETNILNMRTGSGYVDNKLSNVLQLSKDFAIGIEDMRQQFINTLEVNKLLITNKLPSPSDQKRGYLENLERFKTIMQRDVVGINIRVYMRTLIETRIALGFLGKFGVFHWKLKFDPRYRFFKTKKELDIAKEQVHEKIEKFFESEVNIELKRIGYA